MLRSLRVLFQATAGCCDMAGVCFLGEGQGTRNLGGGVAKYCLKTFTTVATTWSGFASQGVLTTTPLMFAALSCTMQVM